MGAIMTIYEKNYEEIKTRPYLLKKLNEFDRNSLKNRLCDIHSADTHEGIKTVHIGVDRRSYRLNSSYYPTKEAQAWAGQYDFEDLKAYISMYGLGNGTFTRALIERMRPEDFIYIYEPSAQLFLYILENYDISDILRDSRVYIGVESINDYEFHAVLRDNIDWLNVHYQVLCMHPFYDEIFPESYKTFLLELKENNIRALINRNTTALFGTMTVTNTIHNFKYIKETNVDLDFQEDFSALDIPAVIVAAGPSLNKNIEYLKQAKGKAAIFVVDRALDYVLNHGIEPDFIVTIDSSKPIEYFSRRTDLTIPLFCTISSSIPVMDAHKGRKILFANKGFESYIYYELKKEVSTLNPGGCVATGAFSVCVGLGFKTIILMGQDLAFSNDKTTHASGIQGDGEDLKKVFKIVEGIDGKPVETRHDWYSYLVWFQDAIKVLPDITVVDATEGGARIAGTRIMTLKDAIAAYCTKEVDCGSIVDNKKPTFDGEDMIRVRQILQEAVENLKEIRESGDRARECCVKLSKEAQDGTIGSRSSQAFVDEISEINETIMKYPAYKFVDNDISVVSIQNLSNIYKLTGDQRADQITTYLKAEKIYEAIAESADKIWPQLESVLNYF
jgi:hypothetical protein